MPHPRQIPLRPLTATERAERLRRRRGAGGDRPHHRGNFRLVQRLFAQIARVREINRLPTVTKEVVEAARESLVIAPLG